MRDDFSSELLRHLPELKSFAINLTGNITRAEDLVQDTVVLALANKVSYRDDGKMAAWLFTILRNRFRSEYRRRHREVEDIDGKMAKEFLRYDGDQFEYLELQEARKALGGLSRKHRDAVLFVAVGYSYEEAASASECAVGTMKSRVNRGRSKLAADLDR
jgi:RNA polymerase sigma-70 factor, ECF subfamily